MEPSLHDRISNGDLPDLLKTTLLEFLNAFEVLPEKPNTINPHYMRFSLNFLADEIIGSDDAENIWWEVMLDLAKKWALDRGEAGQEVVSLIEKLNPLLREHLPNDDSEITLKEITRETVFPVIMLSETLSEPKRYFVAPNAVSLSQAHFSDKAWFRAIYAGKALVGFVMLSVDEDKGEYFVWRLMIAEPYHGRGYGRKAIEAIKAHVRNLPNAAELVLSYGEGPGSPEGFYKKQGFEPTGEVDHGEIIAKITL